MRTITGQLSTPTGEPFAHVSFELIALRSELAYILRESSSTFTTDTDGHYSAEIQTGRYRVLMTYNGTTVPLGLIKVEEGDPISLNALIVPNETAIGNVLTDALTALVSEAEDAKNDAVAAAEQAEHSADLAGTDRATVEALAAEVAANAQQTASDRTATAQDRAATEADRNAVVEKAAAVEGFAQQTAADAEQTAADRLAIEGVEANTAADRAATTADRLQVEADKIAVEAKAETVAQQAQQVAADKTAVETAAVQSHSDAAATAADRDAVAADKAAVVEASAQVQADAQQTAQDREAVAGDREQTAADRVATGSDRGAVAADRETVQAIAADLDGYDEARLVDGYLEIHATLKDQWQVVGYVRGPQGEKGDMGEKGDTGLQGEQGEQGDRGVSVSGLAVDTDNHLITYLSDGSEIDAGAIKVSEVHTVNGVEAVEGNIVLSATDVGAYTQAETDSALAALVDAAPGTLNTLNELAAALGDDPNFATTVTNLIAGKLDQTGKAANSALLDGISRPQFMRSDVDQNFGGTLNYFPDIGVILTLDGRTAMERHSANGALSIGADDGLIIGAGETRPTIVDNVDVVPERLHLGAEGGIYFYTSPDNWGSGWGGRHEMHFTSAGELTIGGNLVYHVGNKPTAADVGAYTKAETEVAIAESQVIHRVDGVAVIIVEEV